MKKFYFFLFAMLIYIASIAQTPNEFYHLINLEDCGLNYQQHTVRLNQRMQGTTFAGSSMPATLNFSGIPANAMLEKAYLWFTAITDYGADYNINNCTLNSPSGNYTFTSSAIYLPINTNPFSSQGICWVANPTYSSLAFTGSYFADVTAFVPVSNLNGTYILDIPINAGFDINGATLMIIYSTPCPVVNERKGKLTLWHGLDVQHANIGTYQMQQNFVYQNNVNSKAFFIVADIENNQSQYSINGSANSPINGNMYNFIENNITLPATQFWMDYKVIPTLGDCYAISVFGVYTQNGDNSNLCTPLIINAGPDPSPICGSGSVSIGGLASGGTSPYTYIWSVIPSNGQQYLTTATSPFTQFNFPGGSTGLYICTLTVTDANGCTATDQVVVTVNTIEQCCVNNYFPLTNVTNRFKSITINNTNSVTAVLLNGQTSTAITTVSNLPSAFSIRDQVLVNAGTPTLAGKTISFGPDAKVEIKKGATLTINNTKLTSIPCAIMWNGVFVDGTPTADQQVSATKQAKFVILNNSIIEDARFAVMNFEPFTLKTGGIIQAENSTFRNNRYAAYFFPYGQKSNVNSVSYFKNCIFETTAALKDVSTYGAQAPQDAFVWIYANNIIGAGGKEAFEDNIFRNTTGFIPFAKRGDGIRAVDGVFTVRKTTSKGGNFFSNLDKAIDLNRSLNTGSSVVQVLNNTFSDNITGIMLTGNNGDYYIKGNNFSQANFTALMQIPNKYGISSDGTTTLKIFQNTFTKQTVGCYLKNSGNTTLDGKDNHVWKNIFTDCGYSVFFDLNNPLFQVHCNNFTNTNSKADAYWIVRNGKIKNPQGNCGGSSKPQGNTFGLPKPPNKDVRLVRTLGSFPNPSFIYYYYQSGTNVIPTPSYASLCTGNGCTLQSYSCSTPNSCTVEPQFKVIDSPNKIAQLLAGATTTEERMKLIAEMIAAHTENGNFDQIIPFLESVPDTEAKWMLVPEYIAKKRFTEAETTLNGLQKDNLEKQKRDDYYKVHIELGKTDRIPTDMTVTEKTTVETVAASETEISHNAKAMLHFWFKQNYEPDFTDMFSTNKMAAPENEAEPENAPVIIAVDEKENTVSGIYPNPNDGTMQMDYQLTKGQKGELLIYDLTGRIIKQFTLGNENNSLQLNLTGGIYFYTVNLNGETVISDKLIVIK